MRAHVYCSTNNSRCDAVTFLVLIFFTLLISCPPLLLLPSQRLVDHPVIRAKFAEMVRQIESSHAWLELVTYQLKVLSKKEQAALGGSIALLKAHASRVFEFCAREALQVCLFFNNCVGLRD